MTIRADGRPSIWRLGDLPAPSKDALRVFSCFHCGGGSSMGYKLAGMDVLGGIEIDPAMMRIYRKNLSPKISYLESIVDFNRRQRSQFPPELLDLDILDGSPPCSVFSTNGKGQKGWGVRKIFREGQAAQILDDLFGHFIQTTALLSPRVMIAENVTGMLRGNARGYIKEIFSSLRDIGYQTQLFHLHADTMGVPQKRERLFFVSNRLGKKLKFESRIPTVSAGDALAGIQINAPKMIRNATLREKWEKAPLGMKFCAHNGIWKGVSRAHPKRPIFTLTAGEAIYHWDQPRPMQGKEIIRLQTFPDDYDFDDQDETYVCGMSVPPLMTYHLAKAIASQILDRPIGNGAGMAHG